MSRRLSRLNVAWDNKKGMCMSVGSMKPTRAFTIAEVISFVAHREVMRHTGLVR